MNIKFLLLSVIFIIFTYYVFRKVIKQDYKKRMRLSMISYLLEILVFGIHANLIYAALQTKFPNFPPFPHDKLKLIISGTLFVSGAFILLFSWFKLGTRPSLGIDKNNLITGGLYQYSRNPQLVGYGFMLAAVTVAFMNWMVLIWFLLYMVICVFMIQSEEEFLTKKYKEDYKKYRNTVSRVIGCKKVKEQTQNESIS
jgi:protein-S-isoprenylcysteine O-methyltransferase Ste14